MSTLSCSVTSTGITAPTYSDILSTLQSAYFSIFGSDAYLGNDSQDGQLLAIFAAAINDNNAATIAAYNSYSPTYAQGIGLSSQVKINGIRRLVATNSTAPVLITGQAGTIINNGLIQDTNSNQWSIPSPITIPYGGSLTVLATAVNVGATYAPTGTITTIISATAGWQSVTNTADATPGNPIETDAQLRQRQTLSTAYAALSTNPALSSAIANISGVTHSVIYENTTDSADSNGLPGHSICVVVVGGDPNVVAQIIADKKSEGVDTYGTTTITGVSNGNTTISINFFEAIAQNLTLDILITAKAGYNTVVATNLKQKAVDFISTLSIGDTIEYSQLIAALVGPTYKLESVSISINGGSPVVNTDVAIPFNGIPSLPLASVTVST